MSRRDPTPDHPVASTHYFDTAPRTASAPRRVHLDLGDVDIEIETDRGVFSHGRLDAGTELLLRRGGPVHHRPGDQVLDLGCGAGAIALVMARRAPDATVWAVDVNERARDLCARNARRLRCDNVRVCAPDVVPADVRFRDIWSNPPIRVGKAVLHDLLMTWMARMTQDGRALLVVQRHLGADSLATWLAEHGFDVARKASSQGYRLLELQPGRVDDDAAP